MEICILKFSGTRVLPRGSSALALAATPEQRLHALESKVLAAQQQQVSP